MMRTLLLILLTTVLLSACGAKDKKMGVDADADPGEGRFNADGVFQSSRAILNSCDDTGGTHINLHYSNYRIKTSGVVNLEENEIFSIRLKPVNNAHNRPGINYETETVTISGKDLASVWLTASGSYATTPAPHHDLVICVPTGISGIFYYNIVITETGSLDPRADVF
jgi:hypothetical protein